MKAPKLFLTFSPPPSPSPLLPSHPPHAHSQSLPLTPTRTILSPPMDVMPSAVNLRPDASTSAQRIRARSVTNGQTQDSSNPNLQPAVAKVEESSEDSSNEEMNVKAGSGIGDEAGSALALLQGGVSMKGKERRRENGSDVSLEMDDLLSEEASTSSTPPTSNPPSDPDTSKPTSHLPPPLLEPPIILEPLCFPRLHVTSFEDPTRSEGCAGHI
ncbi:hypothetical protein BT69DRAFT_633371 [Atractiella rhizophila]|nr:hypothetical protein BT69DRAFT_633371 [Atractiella rhizophila]